MWLCHGLLRLQRSSCAELASESYVQSLVLQVGLHPDGRGSSLYGSNASQSIVSVHGKSARGKVGWWQSPVQLAAALIHVGSNVDVQRYIEVGVFTAWTCCFVSAYLRRVGTFGAFRGFAVDITTAAMAQGTRNLLPHLNVSFMLRSKLPTPFNIYNYEDKITPMRRELYSTTYDFCFIDGDHVYTGVRRDYSLFSPACTYMMFHDIQVM
jgi:hypothetical protein